jgi:hypothetical protein
VGITAGSREVPGRKPVTRDDDDNNNNNNNNNNNKIKMCNVVMSRVNLVDNCDWGTGWTVRASNPVKAKRFFSFPERQDSSSILFIENRNSSPDIKLSGCDVDHSPPSRAEL